MERQVKQQTGFPYSFDPSACEECGGSCCRGSSGNTWVDAAEVRRIAEYLHQSQVDILQRYIRRVNGRLAVRENSVEGEHVCIFFNVQQLECDIYPARPEQCRSFPFWPYYREKINELADECPGVQIGNTTAG